MSQPDASRPTACCRRRRRSRSAPGARCWCAARARPDWEAKRIAELLRIGGDRVSAWGRIEQREGLPGLSRQPEAAARHAAALLAGLGHPGRPAAVARLPRPAAGAGAGSSQGLLAGLAAARPADRRVRASAEPRRDRLLEAQQGLARPRLVLPRRLQLRGQHAELQSHRRDGRAAGRRDDRLGLCDGRRPARARDAAAALLGASSTAARRRCSTTTICRSRSAARRCSPTSRPRRSTG